MAKFVGIIIGGLEIGLGIFLEFIPGGQLLGAMLIAAGVGQVIGGVGTLLNQPKSGLATASRNPIAPWNVIYGRAKVGGTIVYINEFGDTDKWLDLVMVLACHPCQSVDALLFDNQRVVFDRTTGSSRSPTQQTINIVSIARTNDVVSVVLSSPFADVQDGDLVQIQNVSTDHTLNGQFYITITAQNLTQFTYICGGAAISLTNTGQVKTTFPDYRAKVHMEVLLGNHTATFPGMLNGTPYDGDESSPVNCDNNPWDSQHLLLGRTAVFLRLHYNDQVFSGGLPNISFHVSGKNDIADPRNTVLGRPTVLLNGWGNNAHVGAYEEGTDQAFNFGLNDDTTYAYDNPAQACDGDLTSYAAAIHQHTHKYTGCVWSFPAGITSPTFFLNVLSEIPVGQGYYINLRSAGVWYSLDAGSTWTQIYNSPTHPKGWDCVPLPANTDSSKLQVMAFSDSHDDMVQYVYDIQLAPNPTSSGYTTNAALCIADYLTNTTWGFKAVLGTEVPLPELIAAANLCDESVPLADGATEPRYTCNGTFALTVRRGEVLQNLLTACAGRLTYTAGQFVIHPGAWVGSTLDVGSGDAWRPGAPIIVPATAGTFQLDWEDELNGGDQSFGNGSVQIVFDGHGGATIAFLGVRDPDTLYQDDYGVNGTKLAGANVGPGPVAIPSVPAPGTELVVQIFSPDGVFVSGPASHNPDGVIHAYLRVSPPGYAPYAFDLLQSASGPFRWKSKASIRDLYNGVKGTYVSPANGWQTSDMPPYAQDQLHGYSNGPSQYLYDANLAADGGDRRWFEIQLPFTISPATAQRLAKIELLRRRQQGTGTFAFNLSLYQTTVLDVITLSLPYLGWNNKLVEITAHRLTLNKQQSEGNDVTLLGCELDVQETDPSVYEWSVTEELTPQGFQQSSLPNVSNPGAPTSVVASSGSSTSTVGADGVARSRILVTWTAPADGYVTSGGQIQLQYQPVGATTWTALPSVDPTVTQAYIDGVTDGQQYVVQIRSVNAAGVPSAWVPTAAVTVSGSPSSLSVSSIAPAGATSGQVLTYNGTSWTPTMPPPPVNHFSITWGIGIGQPVVVGNDVTPHYLVPFAGTPQEVTLAAKTAPAGADLIVDILHNGTSLFSAPVHLPAGQTQATSTALASGAVLAAGDLLTLNVTQVGSTTPGQDVTIQLLVQLN